MSGGRFDYYQFHINDIIREIEYIIKCEENPELDSENNTSSVTGESYFRYSFSTKTLDKFKEGIKFLKMAEIYAQRIDWLVSGDDGEESFHERLKEDLNENNQS